VGFENRDYYRDCSEGSGFGFDPTAPVCKYLIVANIAVFLLQIFLVRQPSPGDMHRFLGDTPQGSPENEETMPEALDWMRVSVVQEWFELETSKVVRQVQIWRLLTYAFCHDRFGIWHILINMLMLYWFGRTLEVMYGSKEFLLFYLTAAVVAGVCHIGLDMMTRGPSGPAIGASGAIMAVMMLYAIHYPRSRIYIFFVLPVEIRWLLVLYVIFDLHPVLLALAGTPIPTGVAHAAHLGGLAFGFFYHRYNLRLEKYWDRLPRWRWSRWFGPRRHLRVYSAPPDPQRDMDAMVDNVLRKLHEQGDVSLTEAERKLLQSAAERYRQRRQ
jgi:membrane associated rhomboid family serine protease